MNVYVIMSKRWQNSLYIYWKVRAGFNCWSVAVWFYLWHQRSSKTSSLNLEIQHKSTTPFWKSISNTGVGLRGVWRPVLGWQSQGKEHRAIQVTCTWLTNSPAGSADSGATGAVGRGRSSDTQFPCMHPNTLSLGWMSVNVLNSGLWEGCSEHPLTG